MQAAWQYVLAIAVTVFSGLAGMLFGWVPPLNWCKAHPRKTMACAASIAGIAAILSFSVGRQMSPDQAIGNITNLRDEDQVSYPVALEGIALHVPGAHQLWVANRPQGSEEWYPNNAKCDLQPGGEPKAFSCHEMFIGQPGSDRGSFDVYLLDADEDASAQLATHGKASAGDGGGQGLEELPAGAQIIGLIRDVRRAAAD